MWNGAFNGGAVMVRALIRHLQALLLISLHHGSSSRGGGILRPNVSTAQQQKLYKKGKHISLGFGPHAGRCFSHRRAGNVKILISIHAKIRGNSSFISCCQDGSVLLAETDKTIFPVTVWLFLDTCPLTCPHPSPLINNPASLTSLTSIHMKALSFFTY